MAVIKQACPKCGQRVSGDESFYGTSVECPICSSKIFFPDPNGPEEAPNKEESSAPSSRDDKDTSQSPPPLEDVLDDYHDEDEYDDLRPPKRSTPAQVPAQAKAGAVAGTYAEPPSATLSIISMVLGIINAITFCIPSVVLAPAAIICGHIALIKGKFSPIQPAPGRGMAITGLILGYLGMLILLTVLILSVTGLFDGWEYIKNRGGSGD